MIRAPRHRERIVQTPSEYRRDGIVTWLTILVSFLIVAIGGAIDLGWIQL